MPKSLVAADDRYMCEQQKVPHQKHLPDPVVGNDAQQQSCIKKKCGISELNNDLVLPL